MGKCTPTDALAVIDAVGNSAFSRLGNAATEAVDIVVEEMRNVERRLEADAVRSLGNGVVVSVVGFAGEIEGIILAWVGDKDIRVRMEVDIMVLVLMIMLGIPVV